MPIVAGGTVIPPTTAGVTNPGIKTQIYAVEGVPTDANIGVVAGALVNGMTAQNVLTGNIYERQAGAWVRIDTL